MATAMLPTLASVLRRASAWIVLMLLSIPGPAGAAISLVATSTATTGSSGDSSVTIAVPSGTSAGDMLVAQVAVRGGSGTTITAPSGWTQLQVAAQGTSLRQGVYFRFAGASEPASYTFTFSASERGAAGMIAWRGVDAEFPVNASTIRTNASSTTVTANGLTTDLTDTTLVGLFATATATSFGAPSGMSEHYDAGINGVTVAVAVQALTTVGSTGNRNATAADAADNIGALIALKPAVVATAEYRFDECGYTGASGEVRDSVGTAHGTARNGLSVLSGEYIGNAANANRYDHWVQTSMTLSRDWTLSLWFKTPFETSGTRYHVLAAIAGGGDPLYLDRANGLRWGVYTTSGIVDGTYRFDTLSNGWHHLVLVGRGNTTLLYMDGTLVDSVAFKLNGGTIQYVGSSFDYIGTVDAQGWRTPIDEFVLWEGAASASFVATLNTRQRSGQNRDGTTRAPVGCGPARFSVTSGASASTCFGQSVTINAVDGSGALVTSYTGTVNLTTSTGRGAWSAGPASGPVTETGTANDGQASYTFRAGDLGTATLVLSNQSADDLTVTARDSVTSAIVGTSGTVSFRNNTFVVSVTDALGTTGVAGRPHAMTLTLFRRDVTQSPANCAIATNYTGSRSLKAWYSPDGSHPAGASAPAVNAGAALPVSVPGSSNVSLTFTAGVAAFQLTTTDVGKYSLSIRDDSRTFAGAVDIDGSSETLTFRPFALAVTAIAKGATANPEGTATSGAKFVAAGDTFSATVGGYLWHAADDADNDGNADTGANVLDNGLAPRFAWATALSATFGSGDLTPVGGANGTLGGTTAIAQGTFSSGAATVTDLTYSEAGSMGIAAMASNYLNTAGVSVTGRSVNPATGQAARVGRFHPSHFTVLAGATVTTACTSGGFTYMDEPGLAVSFTLEARNLADAVTTNYRATGYQVGTVALVAENADNGTDLSARVSGLSAASWALGRYTLNATGATFARTAAPDGPYDSLVLGVAATDPDGAVIASRDMNASVAGCGGGCTAKALNPAAATRARFGRLRVGSALGAPTLALPVPLTIEYWNGTGFATHSRDNCTRLTNTQAAFGNFRGALSACLTSGQPAGADGITFASGRGSLRLSRPGVRGSVDLTLQLGATASGNTCSAGASAAATAANRPWLRGNWGAATYDRNPAGRAVFGVHSSSQDVIFLRESY